MISLLKNSFNAGLLTPLMDARTDLEKYSAGCRYLQNFMLTAYGGVRKRGGFEFINACVTDGKASRLLPFEVSRKRSYILEFAEGVIRFFRDGKRVVNGMGVPIEVAAPYLEADLPEIQFAQVNDVLFLAHPNYMPRRLSRLGDAVWTLAEEAFSDAPFLDENEIETITVTPGATTGTIVSLIASSPIFSADHVGSVWGISHERAANDYEITRSLSSSGVSPLTMRAQGTIAIITQGTGWTGTLKVQRREIGSVTWVDYRTYNGDGTANIAPPVETEDTLMEYRLNYTGTGNGTATLQCRTAYARGVVKIKTFISTTNVTVEILRPLYSTAATFRWSEAAWSEVSGYPGTICFYESRVWYAGTAREPQNYWASAQDNYLRFIKGTLATDSFKGVLAATELNAILWMVAARKLVIGTSGGEWVMNTRTGNGALTPESAVAVPQSAIGSEPIQARLIGSSILFVDYGARRLFDYTYDYNSDQYQEADLTFIGEQVTAGGIKGIAYMKRPDPIVWANTGYGKLIGFTYMKKQQVAGWHPHEVGGFVESVACIRGDNAVDELWISVRRIINGQTKRYLERMSPNAKEIQENEASSDYFYVDSGRSFQGTGIDKVTVGASPNLAFRIPLYYSSPGNFHSWTSGPPPTVGFRAALSVTDEGYDSFRFVWSFYNNSVPVAIWNATGATDDINAAGPWVRSLGPSGTAPTFLHDSGNIRELTGMGHLEGQTVAILADGMVLADKVVTAGKVNLGGGSYLKVTAGLRMKSILQPMTLEFTGNSGSSRTKTARVVKVIWNFYKTLGGKFGAEPDGLLDGIKWRETSSAMGRPTPVFTGEKEAPFNKGYTTTPRACLVHDDPLPCSVLALTAEMVYSK